MTTSEMKTKFSTLYGIMANSRKISGMKLFGSVLCELMYRLIEEHPEQAELYIERLCAVKWNNYLTHNEAEAINSRMKPPAHWDYDSFSRTVNNIGGSLEQKPCFNKDSLWIAMNMVYSDGASSIASIVGRELSGIPEEQIANAVYLLATDKLCDEDEVFNIRSYFQL